MGLDNAGRLRLDSRGIYLGKMATKKQHIIVFPKLTLYNSHLENSTICRCYGIFGIYQNRKQSVWHCIQAAARSGGEEMQVCVVKNWISRSAHQGIFNKMDHKGRLTRYNVFSSTDTHHKFCDSSLVLSSSTKESFLSPTGAILMTKVPGWWLGCACGMLK